MDKEGIHSKCQYCLESFRNAEKALQHCAQHHPTRKMAILWPMRNSTGKLVKYKKRLFDVTGDSLKCDIHEIKFYANKVHLPTRTIDQSPVHKMHRLNTPTKKVHRQLFADSLILQDETVPSELHSMNKQQVLNSSEICLNENVSDNRIQIPMDISVTVEPDKLKPVVDTLQKLLPYVTKHLADNNRLEEWVAFFHMVNDNKFDVNHIASQLFWDVVKYAQLGNAQSMRFSSEVKQFWAVGLAIFHSKFIRFMGGYKGQCLSTDCSATSKRKQETDVTKINFIVPNYSQVKDEISNSGISCETPGIIHSNLDIIAKDTNLENKNFKLCIDGKKLTAGFGKCLGDVDLYGHETEPTLKQRRERLDIELMLIRESMLEIEKYENLNKITVNDLSEENKNFQKNQLCSIISVLTERIKELRLLKVKKDQAIEKFMKLTNEPWQQSKYAFAISSMKTQIHRINICIDDALKCNNRLAFTAAACNNVPELFCSVPEIELDKQPNYVCLKEMLTYKNVEIPSELIKQRTEAWQEQRKKAKVTGSSLHKAIGLSTLREQKQHFDKVTGTEVSSESEFSDEVKRFMKYGEENELNAVGTLVGKVLPVYAPNGSFFEEGCYTLNRQDDCASAVISPDGSVRIDGKPDTAIEIKCPIPGKKYTPDVHYTIPEYYICQILSEMAALDAKMLFYLCWTPQSCTIFRAEFDRELWSAILDEADSLYGTEAKPIRPQRRSKVVVHLKDMLKKYSKEKVHLIAELPAVVAVQCSHSDFVSDKREIRGYHCNKAAKKSHENDNYSLYRITEVFLKVETLLNDIYSILRIPAKEVVVALVSDLDRMRKREIPHAFPIAYGLSGYSLKVETMRSIMCEIIEVCYKKGIVIRTVSTDGQFYTLGVRAADGKPLTILQLAKDTWEKTKKQTKQSQIQMLMSLNARDVESSGISSFDIDVNYQDDAQNDTKVIRGPIVVRGWRAKPWPVLYNPPKLMQMLKSNSKQNDSDDKSCTSIAQMLPPDAMNNLPDDFENISESELLDNMATKSSTVDLSPMENDGDTVETGFESDTGSELVTETIDTLSAHEIDVATENVQTQIHVEATHQNAELTCHLSIILPKLVEDLQENELKRKHKKWNQLNQSKLQQLLCSEPTKISRSFTKQELLICALSMRHFIEPIAKNDVEKMTKLQLVNTFSELLGNKSKLSTKRSPKKLRCLLKDFLNRKLGKDVLNAVLATKSFIEDDLPAWRTEAVFKDGITIGSQEERYTWYCQPELFPKVNEYVQFLLDCHHLFVNARCFISQNGISGLGLNKKAWIDVAETNHETKTGLNIAMVRDVIDRQSNAIAKIMFSEKVEEQLRKLGWKKEAVFCSVIRNWYNAEDEPGLNVLQRHKARMEMRNILLDSVNIAEFPPPGSHVAGMPIVMFEGLLTNIDRRTQLYAMVPGKTYNVRAPNTLDAENLFSEFQDLDPKSTGALLADDVPAAIETASYLMQMRLKPNRKFLMRTSKRERVYPANPLHSTADICDTEMNNTCLPELTNIPMRNHPFDGEERRRRKPARKSAVLPDVDEPARGTRPVRQYHRVDSSKVLPHIRHGLNFE